MTRNRYYSAYGFLKPRHTAGTYPVRIYAYRWEKYKGKYSWRSKGSFSARAYTYSNYTKYKGNVRLTLAGTWKPARLPHRLGAPPDLECLLSEHIREIAPFGAPSDETTSVAFCQVCRFGTKRGRPDCLTPRELERKPLLPLSVSAAQPV